jgi:hypothetical protein
MYRLAIEERSRAILERLRWRTVKRSAAIGTNGKFLFRFYPICCASAL